MLCRYFVSLIHHSFLALAFPAGSWCHWMHYPCVCHFCHSTDVHVGILTESISLSSALRWGGILNKMVLGRCQWLTWLFGYCECYIRYLDISGLLLEEVSTTIDKPKEGKALNIHVLKGLARYARTEVLWHIRCSMTRYPSDDTNDHRRLIGVDQPIVVE
jgi:hypothetical protein